MAGVTKIFIVDNNSLIRYAVSQMFSQENGMKVVGDSVCNDESIQRIKEQKPDIIIFDIPLPRETGIAYLKSLAKLRMPVIVFTKSDKTIAQDLIPLLEAGAVGFVLKPSGHDAIDEVKDQLLHEIKINVTQKKQTAIQTASVRYNEPLKVVAIGSSTGGPEALAQIIGQFPENFSAGIAIVQHMPELFTEKFARRLDGLAHITVKEAKDGDILEAGVALVAPGGKHMVFERISKGKQYYAKVKLTLDPAQWKLRPTVDKMMTSLAPIYKNHIVGVILTGMGEDGVIGMRAIKEVGGRTVVQNKETSVVYGMGQQVIKNNLADKVLPLDKIIPTVVDMISS